MIPEVGLVQISEDPQDNVIIGVSEEEMATLESDLHSLGSTHCHICNSYEGEDFEPGTESESSDSEDADNSTLGSESYSEDFSEASFEPNYEDDHELLSESSGDLGSDLDVDSGPEYGSGLDTDSSLESDSDSSTESESESESESETDMDSDSSDEFDWGFRLFPGPWVSLYYLFREHLDVISQDPLDLIRHEE